jgi:hypothetical protein
MKKNVFFTLFLLLSLPVIGQNDTLGKDERYLILDFSLRSKPSFKGEVLEKLFEGDIVVLDTTQKEIKGFSSVFFQKDSLNTIKGYIKTNILGNNTQYKIWLQNMSTSTNRSGSTNNSNSRTIHTGRRGGKFYYNSSGNKTYIKKKK